MRIAIQKHLKIYIKHYNIKIIYIFFLNKRIAELFVDTCRFRMINSKASANAERCFYKEIQGVDLY